MELSYDELLVQADALTEYIKDLSRQIISDGRDDLRPTREIARGLLVKTVAAQRAAGQRERAQ